jgi:uncharacterized protein YgiB involved in biofilm formation
MLKRARKSSSAVTLVLIGAAALGAGSLSGCSKEEIRRDVYASKADCLADWGHTPQDCEPAYDRPTGNGAVTHYYGRPYSYTGSSPSHSGRTIASSTVSRGGFGSSGHSSSG